MQVEPSPQSTTQSRPVFEIGLVMAGAISAGAYTAGVVDFLIEALDRWYATHNGNPPHDVKLRVVSGASAGGMVGSIFTAALGGDTLQPVKDRPEAGTKSKNELYRAWVQEIDIVHLLQSKDLDRKRLLSVLDSTKLREIAQHAIEVKPVATPAFSKRRPYLADPFELILSVANLRGVPYILALQGGVERMTCHADYMHFAVGANPPREPAIMLDPSDYSTEEWKTLSKAALATGAFPFGLAPHNLSRNAKEYAGKRWPVTLYKDGQEFTEFRALTPELPDAEETYDFLCVDGGLLNNEPFNLAHSVLTPQSGGRNEQGGLKSDRAIVLIAPFPSGAAKKYQAPGNLLSFSGSILSSLLAQVRFSPEELLLASDDNIYSRFMISPKRPERFEQGDIACGTLEGFGGFIHEPFRHHDFMLGRRNCQRFLEAGFTLPCGDESGAPGNPLFANWDEASRQQFRVRSNADRSWQLPIIPCVGAALNEAPLPDWPSYPPEKIDRLLRQIGGRMTNAGKLFIDLHAKSWISRSFLRTALWAEKGKVLRWIRGTIVADLREHKVLSENPRKKRPWKKLIFWLFLIGIAAAAAVSVWA